MSHCWLQCYVLRSKSLGSTPLYTVFSEEGHRFLMSGKVGATVGGATTAALVVVWRRGRVVGKRCVSLVVLHGMTWRCSGMLSRRRWCLAVVVAQKRQWMKTSNLLIAMDPAGVVRKSPAIVGKVRSNWVRHPQGGCRGVTPTRDGMWRCGCGCGGR